MNENLDYYRDMARIIEEYIRPATFPLAVKLIHSEEEIDPTYKRPLRDLQVQNFVCQNFKMSRSYGWTIAITADDVNCKAARSVYNWDTITEETRKWMHDFHVGLYAKDSETSNKLDKHIFRLENDFYGMVISPLARTKIVPDVVLTYCLPAQAMRFIQGYLYIEGGALDLSAAGRIGSCHEGITKPLITGQPQLVILGNGDRVWGGAQDHEVMFSCPREKLPILIEGLEATHMAGLRYPVPTYMNYTPGFQESFQNKAMKRAGETLVRK